MGCLMYAGLIGRSFGRSMVHHSWPGIFKLLEYALMLPCGRRHWAFKLSGGFRTSNSSSSASRSSPSCNGLNKILADRVSRFRAIWTSAQSMLGHARPVQYSSRFLAERLTVTLMPSLDSATTSASYFFKILYMADSFAE